MSRRLELILLFLVLALGATLRFLWLDIYPPGWHHDEALMGVMASEVYRGIQRPIFFPGYAGQEPLYIYLAAGMMALMGGNQDILPLRLTSALVGLAIVLVAYLLGRELFNRRVGLLGAALLATNFWQVMSSRNAYRSITQPLVEALAIYLFWHARRTGKTVWFVLAGAALAGTTYTYLGGRSFPAVLLAYGLWSLLFQGRPSAAQHKRLLALGGAAVLVAAPIYVYWITHPGSFGGRIDQVSILNPAINKGQPLHYIGESIRMSLGMFTFRGDLFWRYNIPGRPIFEWAVVPAFYLGILVLLRRAWQREAASALLLLWMLVMLAPSALSYDEAGYTLRAVGLVPALFLVPALGLIAAWDWLARRAVWRPALRVATPIVIVAIVLFDGVLTYRDYFLDWAQQFGAAYEGDAHVVAEARYLAAEAHPEREEVFAGSDYRGHPIISQLAPNVYQQLRWFDGSQSVVYTPGLSRDSLYVLNFRTLPQSIDRYFPPETLISMQRFDRGIDPANPPPKYVAYRLSPAQVQAQIDHWLGAPESVGVKANFGDQVEVLAAQVPRSIKQGEKLPVTVIWRVLRPPSAEDYMFFAHLVDDQGTMWAQVDRNGYPTGEWRLGDVVVSRYDLAVPKTLDPGKYFVDFGLYDREGTRRLPVVGVSPERTTVALPSLKVVSSEPPSPARIRNPLERKLGESIELLGFSIDKARSSDGRPTVDVHLLWSALAKPPEDYTVFVQVLSAEGKLVAQSDAMPGGNRFVTSIWDPGELVNDRHLLTLDAKLPEGSYRVIAGMYLLRTGQRLPVAQGGDFVDLGQLALP